MPQRSVKRQRFHYARSSKYLQTKAGCRCYADQGQQKRPGQNQRAIEKRLTKPKPISRAKRTPAKTENPKTKGQCREAR
jgi:hypothetical protein